MDKHINTEIKVLFFGAGRKGKYWLRIFRDFGIEPEGFIDNNKDLWGILCENVMIYRPDDLGAFRFRYIFITCNMEYEIFQQLLELGVECERIIAGYHNIWNHLLYSISKNIIPLNRRMDINDEFVKKKILFDLQNGMVLGGVEEWTYEIAKGLREKDYQGLYLTTDTDTSIIHDNTFPVYTMNYKMLEKEKEKIEICVRTIIENLPCTMICNFPQYTFWSSCLVKQLYPNKIRIIAIQHSDDIVYYEAYSLWKSSIDLCMTISSRMEHKLKLLGMEPDKLGRLQWQIPCKENLKRTWSRGKKPLQIGYAGRITVASKRTDLLLILAEKLREKHINFQMNIAGTGDYSETLYQRIQEKNFQEWVIPMGYIERRSISDFWRRQDIMISCSEIEGHSISQSEAMAQGAVPVITDVSGARDDVTDEYNGFVVEVGDIDALADKIEELYLDRSKLEEMGSRAYETIYKRQKNMDQAAFWDDLIKEVWKQ